MQGDYDLIKARIRSARSAGNDYSLSYTQHLDIACRLVFNAPSLNHYKADPGAYTWFEVGPFRDMLARLQGATSLLAPVVSEAPELPSDYSVYQQWEIAADILMEAIASPAENPLSEFLLQATDLGELQMPAMVGEGGALLSPLDPEFRLPPDQRLGLVVSSWLPSEYRDEGRMLLGLWERMKRIALEHGMPADVADYYRSICREVHNHSWSVEAHAALGVLDVPLEKGSFFIRHSTAESAKAAIETIWEVEEPQMSR